MGVVRPEATESGRPFAFLAKILKMMPRPASRRTGSDATEPQAIQDERFALAGREHGLFVSVRGRLVGPVVTPLNRLSRFSQTHPPRTDEVKIIRQVSLLSLK